MVPKTMNEDDIKTLFSKYGEIEELSILRGNDGNSKGSFPFPSFSSDFERSLSSHFIIILVSKGCAFLKFRERSHSQAAIEELNGKLKLPVALPLFPLFCQVHM